MGKIKILTVDDSMLIRMILQKIFSADMDFDEVDQAENGYNAIEMIKKKKYDVVTLDLEMPGINGIDTLKEIMKIDTLPVVIISSLTTAQAKETFDALECGAVDFVTKPQNIFSINDDNNVDEIINKVKAASRISRKTIADKLVPKRHEIRKSQTISSSTVTKTPLTKPITKPINRTSDMENINVKKPKLPKSFPTFTSNFGINKLVAIGTSTGGPRALQEVIPKISKSIDSPILIVQHMPKGFTKSLADRLDKMSQIHVKEAEDNEVLQKGVAYIAPGDRHLKIKPTVGGNYKIYLDDSENVSGHKPSVDAMFYSISKTTIPNMLAIVLTGMGADGAKGLSQLKTENNAITIAEDESTCVVFGMPKSAIRTGKVDKIVPLNKVAEEINKIMEG